MKNNQKMSFMCYTLYGDNMKIYKCSECGNVIFSINEELKTLMCCQKYMEELIPNTQSGAVEKHIPVSQVIGDIEQVTVGEQYHPMQENHYITFIAQITKNEINIVKLKPNDKPVANFKHVEGAKIYAYCNNHGLWSGK